MIKHTIELVEIEIFVTLGIIIFISLLTSVIIYKLIKHTQATAASHMSEINTNFKVIIDDVVQVAEGLAAGNLTVSPQADYGTEFSHLKKVLETTLVNQNQVIKDIIHVSQGLATKDLNVIPQAEYSGDFIAIKRALQEASIELTQATIQTDAQNWIKTGQANLNETIRGEQDIVNLARNIINFVCDYVNAKVGLFYLLQDDYLQIITSYDYISNNERPNKISLGEGLIGRVALKQKPLYIHQTADESPNIIRSGLSNTIPYYISVLPCLYEDYVKAVLEIGTSTELSDIQREFLEQILPNIGIVINTADSRTQMQALLEQSQQQATELQQKQIEMLQTNEELQSQSEELRSQSEELQVQQEELKQSNEILGQQTRNLEQQKFEIQEKNKTLEKTQTEITIKAEELELASKYKSEFLANMSHELRTPLNSLLILAKLLTDNKPKTLNEQQIEYAKTIHSAGDDLLTLINDILDLSKVEAGKIEIQLENISIPELLETIQQKFHPVAEHKNLKFDIRIADDIPQNLTTDGQLVKQIINNLLSNAFKFTKQGTVKLLVQHPTKIPDNI